MSKFLIYQKGKQVTDRICLSALESEASVGVFESLRTYGTNIFKEEEHLWRFQESLQSIASPVSISIQTLKEELRKALRAHVIAREQSDRNNLKTGLLRYARNDRIEDLFLRLCLWQNEIFVFVGARSHPKQIYELGVNLSTSPVKRTHTNAQSPQVKTSAYSNAFLASLEIKPENTYEWVFLDASGYVTEVRIGNLFMVKRGTLYTPPEDGILNGVTRSVVIECALRNRIKFEETRLTRHDIYNADEAFLTNTSWEILPVAKLDGRVVGENIPGPMIQKLQKTFKQIVKEESL